MLCCQVTKEKLIKKSIYRVTFVNKLVPGWRSRWDTWSNWRDSNRRSSSRGCSHWLNPRITVVDHGGTGAPLQNRTMLYRRIHIHLKDDKHTTRIVLYFLVNWRLPL